MDRHEIAHAAKLPDALARMKEALGILDEASAPGEIGGHLDLAISRLEEALGLEGCEPILAEEFISPLDELLEKGQAARSETGLPSYPGFTGLAPASVYPFAILPA
jgi:hypothetical protein